MQDTNRKARYVANMSWLALERVATSGIRACVLVLVVRYLGPENKGIIAYAESLVGLFGFLALLGLDDVAVGRMVEDPSREHEIIGTVSVFRLGGAATATLLLMSVAAALGIRGMQLTVVGILGARMILSSLSSVALAFQARVESKHMVHVKLGAAVIEASGQTVCVLMGVNLVWICVVTAVSGGLESLGQLLMYGRHIDSPFRMRFRLDLAKSLARAALPLLLTRIFVSVYLRVDQLFIRHLLGLKAVGIYSCAVGTCEFVYAIPVVISTTFYPMILRDHGRERSAGAGSQAVMDCLVWLGLITSLLYSLCSGPAIRLIYGAQYGEASPVLSIYAWSIAPVFVGIGMNKWYVARGLNHLVAYRTFAGMVANIVLNLLWIPRWGLRGAALATVVSYYIATFFTIPFLSSTLPIMKVPFKSLHLGLAVNRAMGIRDAARCGR